MANYANQTVINIMDLQPPLQHIKSEDSESFLMALNWHALLNVMTDLEPSEYMLWQYLLKWSGQKYYNFSPADLEINFGWSENSARKYRDMLMKKGYLEKVSKNQYVFNPYPSVVEERAAAIREQNRLKHEAHKK